MIVKWHVLLYKSLFFQSFTVIINNIFILWSSHLDFNGLSFEFLNMLPHFLFSDITVLSGFEWCAMSTAFQPLYHALSITKHTGIPWIHEEMIWHTQSDYIKF